MADEVINSGLLGLHIICYSIPTRFKTVLPLVTDDEFAQQTCSISSFLIHI